MLQCVCRRPARVVVGNTGGSVTSRSFSVNTERLQPWLSRTKGLLLSWLQRANVGPSSASGAGQTRSGLLSLFADHCSFLTSQRIRRAFQIGEYYSNLYSERTRATLVGSIWRRFQNRHAPRWKAMAALAGVFMWEKEKIQDEDIRRCGEELQAMETVKYVHQSSVTVSGPLEADWEIVTERKDLKVWKRPLPDSSMHEYKVLGTYEDITPRQFFNVQLDTEYRKKWDSLVIKLDVVDRDANTGSEVVHWATHFPYPMCSRDYVYVRRYSVDVDNNLMVLVSRAVQHPRIPESKEYVRVHTYQSKMVIRPHKSFDENGFDYLLTYSDDPQTVFPRYCVNWMVSSGMPEFLGKLHSAALRATNQEVGIYDYVGVIRSSDTNSQPSKERLTKENLSTGSHGPLYA